jgi:hypothetical protein
MFHKKSSGAEFSLMWQMANEQLVGREPLPSAGSSQAK